MKRHTSSKSLPVFILKPEDFGIGVLFERVPDAVVVHETGSGRIVLWNRSAERLFGYEEAEIIGLMLAQVIPAGIPTVWSPSGFAEVVACHKDGKPLVIELSSSPVVVAGQPQNYQMALMRDVTARVAEKANRQAQIELLDASHDAIFIFAPDLRLTFWNQGAETMYGWSSADAIGQPIGELLKTRYPIPIEAILAELFSRGIWEGELIHTRRDASEIVVASRWIVRRNEEGVPHAILGTNNNITAAKHLELALRESEARFKSFMDAGPVIAFIRDEDGRYVYVNRPHQQHFQSADWIGTTVFDHFPATLAATIRESDRRVLETGQPGQFEEEIPLVGDVLHTLAFKFPFVDLANRRFVGSAAIDITSLKRAQSKIQRQAEALSAANRELQEADRYKDEFLAILSHELRTPLNYIVGFASVLDEEVAGPLNHQVHGYLGKVLYGAERLLAVVDNLLDMSRIVADKLVLASWPTSYAAVIEQVLDKMLPVAAEKEVTLLQDVAVPNECFLDGERIRHVLINLVDNAIKFTAPGGQVRVKAYTERGFLVTEVSDTGIGIAADDIPKLFKRFRQLNMSATREAGGMGLGLALAKAIVEGHGGTIGVTSVQGEGSTFRFDVPLRSEPGSLGNA